MNILSSSLFNLDECVAKDIFNHTTYPWEVLKKIEDFILHLSKKLPKDYERISETVWIGKGTRIESTALIKGPAIIGYDCDIRHSAFIRENSIIGNQVIAGNSTEVKNSILFNGVQVPHFNYIGDSILGYKVHLGAGVILSNFKSDGRVIKIYTGIEYIDTGLNKFGALIGDHVEIGCNSVLNPGTIVGRNCIIYPLSSVRGIIPERQILKNNGKMHERT